MAVRVGAEARALCVAGAKPGVTGIVVAGGSLLRCRGPERATPTLALGMSLRLAELPIMAGALGGEPPRLDPGPAPRRTGPHGPEDHWTRRTSPGSATGGADVAMVVAA